MRIVTDFERGLRNACALTFPGVTLQGCFFHLVRVSIALLFWLCVRCKTTPTTINITCLQAFIRYAKEVLNMGAALKRGPINYIVKLCCALALLPERLMRRGFLLIMREARGLGPHVYRQVMNFLNYVLTSWLNNDVKRHWMCFFGSFHRTNNTCECHNRVLRRTLGLTQPNIYNFIGMLL